MDGCVLLIKVPQSVKTAKREKDNQFYSVVDINCPKIEKSSQTKLATGACKSWIFFAVDNFPPCIPVTFFPQYRAPVAGQPEPPSFAPCSSCSFFWTRDAFHKFSHTRHGGADIRSVCWFRPNILKLIQKWQGSSSSFGEIYRYGFVSFMSLCKGVCFIRGRGEPHVFVSSEARVSVTGHVCACVLVCVFLQVESQDSTTTEPE